MSGLVQEFVDHWLWCYFRLRYGRQWQWYWLNYEHAGEILW